VKTPLSKIWIERLIVGGSCLGWNNVYPAAFLIEFNLSIDQSEEGPITTGTDIVTGDEFSSALTDENTTGGDHLASEAFNAKALTITVTAISATALTFFMCHKFLEFNIFNL
jgi:hypothetical protein